MAEGSVGSGAVPGAPRSGNIVWSHSDVTPDERRELSGHGSATVWLTGLSGSGKSTIAVAAERRLVAAGMTAYVLDGDKGVCVFRLPEGR